MEKKTRDYQVLFLILAGVLLRIILAGFCKGHASDLGCFLSWADRMTETGCSGFYSETVFTDYPPGYMYILWAVGWINRALSLSYLSFGSLLLIKLPAIICDTLTALFLYKYIGEKNKSSAFFVTVLYFLNPAILLNSSIWGQVDSVFTVCVLLTLYLLSKKKMPGAYFAFALGILIKPQTLIFTPVVLYGVWEIVWKDGKFNLKEFSKQSVFGLLAVLSLFAGMMPFGLNTVINQYINTMSSYPYASVNAYNIWNLFGLNWVSQENTVLGLSYNKLGSLAIFCTVILSAYIFYKKRKDKDRYYISAAVIISGMFLFSVRMHERYLYPVIVLLLAAYAVTKSKTWLFAYVLFSVGHFMNVAQVLSKKQNIVGELSFFSLLTSLLLLASFFFFIYRIFKEKPEKEISREEKTDKPVRSLFSLGKMAKLSMKDYLFILIIMIIYGGIAFYNLGDSKAPESSYTFTEENNYVMLDFGTSTYLSKISYYLGNYENREFTLEAAKEAEGPYYPVTEWTMEHVFAWDTIMVNEIGQYFKITAKDSKAVVSELVFYDFDGNAVTPLESYPVAESLYDEPDIFDGRASFHNSTYFDEIYHARTAYEYNNGLYSYENTHPPLGKILISLGIRLFGMNPFGWRFMGTLFGILMIPAFYIFAYRLFENRFISGAVCLLFTFDFMHFAQTRIATIDVFVTFFIILMYLFMYSYIREEKKIWLFLSGLSMGLGMACKWTGVYAGAGLAIIFFAHLYIRYKNQKDKEDYKKEILKTCLWCVLFFVIIPAAIYTLSYLPFRDGSDNGLIMRMFKNQQNMLSYHTSVDAAHPYSSWWYQWPTMYRPIWYYSGTISDTVKEGISSFGNPLVWWAGIPAFFYCVFKAVRQKDGAAAFLSIAYLAQYLPWFFVTRITFIYHYFPSVPFVVLMIGYLMYQLLKEDKHSYRKYIICYVTAAVILFVLFYPVLSGLPVSVNYVNHFLRWFDSWVLI